MSLDILLLTPDSPFPSESGAALRNYGIIRGLHAAGHRVTLLTFCEGESVHTDNPLFEYCQDVHSCPIPQRSKVTRIVSLLTSNKADIEQRLASETYSAKLGQLLSSRRFEVIQFSGIELGCYLPQIQSAQGTAKVVYDALNAEAELQRLIQEIDSRQPRRWHAASYSALQASRLKRFERYVCQTASAVIAVSEEDRDQLATFGNLSIHVMPNGIFADDYESAESVQRADRQLVFTGKMDYRPNVDAIEWFCEAILPTLVRTYPDIRLVIVGRNPHSRIQALSHLDRVEITGWVNSVLPYLQTATVFVAPLRMGSGTRLKILEAMAAGCAVVTTSLGASGLQKQVRDTLAIAENADTFSDVLMSLLADARRREDMGRQAREQVRRHYDWPTLVPNLLRAYEDIGLG